MIKNMLYDCDQDYELKAGIDRIMDYAKRMTVFNNKVGPKFKKLTKKDKPLLRMNQKCENFNKKLLKLKLKLKKHSQNEKEINSSSGSSS